MDAISFVLGIKSSHLRSTQLRDLIYRGRVIRTTKINADGTATEADGNADGQTQENGSTQASTQTSSQRNDPTSAWVMAVFEDDAGEIHRWKRTITSAGTSEYRIDNRVVSQKAYNDALEEQSILIKARNFLVFQGDVESVASQNPKELTRLIEQISGSLEYKADYERLKIEAEEATENQTNQLVERRKINAELKLYQEQKAEADDYERKVAERDEAIVTHVLWKLFHFQQTIESSTAEIAKHQEELKEHKRGVEKYERRLEEARQAQAKVTREVNKVERSIKDKEKEIENAQNNLVPVDEKIRISTTDLKKYQERIAQLKKERDTQKQMVERYKKDLATVQKAQQKWEDDFRAASQQGGRELSQQDHQEYSRLRGEVTKQTHANQIEINKLEREVNTDRDTARNLKTKVDGLQGHVDRLNNDIALLQSQLKEEETNIKGMQKERTSQQQQYDKVQSDRKQAEIRIREINQMLQDNIRKLHEADSGRRQSRKEIQIEETVAKMKSIYGSGVHGLYRKLCRPKQRKYDTAVATLLGWHLDAVIVDTDKTARECINYLKENQIGKLSFIPLDTITIKAVNPNLKGMHPGMRLAIDCVSYDSFLERAVASACGDAIICDDIKIAKHLCYEKRINVKAVTLDGTVIAKAGTMTGGRLGSDRNNRAWSDQSVENLQKIIEKQRAELAALPKQDRHSQEEDNLQSELASLEKRIQLSQREIKDLERNIDSKGRELQFHNQQLRDMTPKYRDAEQRLANHESQLKRYQDAVNEVADQVFASFCQRLGYSSIREYEDQQGTVQQEAAEKRAQFNVQRSKLQNQLSYHEKQLSSIVERITALKERAQRDEANIGVFEAEREELQNSIDVLQAELETFEERRTQLQQALADRAAVVSDARKDLSVRSESVKEDVKAIDAQEAVIKRTAASRYALLRKCRMEEIKLPLAEGSAPLNRLPMGETARPDPDAMDLDEDPDSPQLQQPEVDDYGIIVDFDDLDPELKEVRLMTFTLVP
jgi:structural maintenance of chromosome 1